MKITLSCQNFITVANMVTKGLNPKDNQSQTILKLEENNIILQHRSATSFFKGTVAILDKEGSTKENTWAIDGAQLKIILSIIKEEEEVVLHVKDDSPLFYVITSKTQLKLPIFEAPSILKEEPLTKLGTVNAVEFLSTLQDLSKITMSSEVTQNHPVSCIHIVGTNDNLSIFSADSVSFMQKTINIDSSIGDFTVLVKTPQASLLNDSQFTVDDVLDIYKTDNMFGYVDKYGTLCLVSVANLPPLNCSNFTQLVSDEQHIIVNLKQLKYAIDSLSKLCSEGNTIKLVFNEKGLIVENQSDDQIIVETSGQCPNTKLKLLRKSLSTLCGILPEKAELCWKGDSGSAVINFKCLDENGDYDNSIFSIITTHQEGN